MEENWRWIPGWECLYMASSCGRIMSFRKKTPFVMSPLKSPKGYVRVDLCFNKTRKSILIHRLVAMTFIPNPKNKLEINHKNGVKNDNRVDNLEWATRSENEQHSRNVLGKRKSYAGLGKIGKLNKKSKKIAQIDPNTGNVVNEFHGTNESYRKTGISQGNIAMVARGERILAGGFKWNYI